MGQYFKAANLDKKESFQPDGIKFMEHSYIDNDSVEAVMFALSKTWKRQRIVWVGDYAYDTEPYEYPEIDLNIPKTFDLSHKAFLYNVDKKEKVDMALYNKIGFTNIEEWVDNEGKKETWSSIIHPLPILVIAEGGGGGGDYHNDEDPMLGAWTGDRIFVSYKNFKTYKDITYKVLPIEDRDFDKIGNNYTEYYNKRISRVENLEKF
tara:strand:- start:1753 stop:2373 length:621 start_codon:yes stop_codon:yes gene_type:complete